MTASAGISRFNLEPGVSGLALDGTGQVHATDQNWAVELGPVADLTYKRGWFIWKLAKSAASVAGAATLAIKAGSATLKTVVIDLTASQTHQGKTAIPLAGLEGTQGITATLTVDTAADAAVTGDFYAAVDIEIPLVSGC